MKIVPAKVEFPKSDKLARGIRQCLDSQSRAPAPRLNDTDEAGRILKAPCKISLDPPKSPTAVIWTGKLHGVTEDGTAILVTRRIAPGSFAWIEVQLPAGGTAQLTGHVVDTAALSERCHLTRIRFSDIGSPMPPAEADHQSVPLELDGRAKTTPATAPRKSRPEPETRTERHNRRERDLRMLRSVAKNGISNKETFRDVARLTISPDHLVRLATIPALFEIRGSEAELALINLLRDPNATVLAEAAEMLGHLDAERAITPLTKLLDHQSVTVQLRAAEALGRLRDQSGLPVAVKFLRSDHEHTSLAARALGAILGERFRPGQRGVNDARLFLKQR
ncbi:MAG: HEAT repeat domain-containing protein [Planctomycetes bacterium]|nr:HEAT repeat domain-containing protein [Planctomycetota bacterium]